MGRPRKLTMAEEEQIRKRFAEGETQMALATEFKVWQGCISRVVSKEMARRTRRTIAEVAFESSQKLMEAVQTADPTDKDDRRFISEAFKASADRAGMSPQAIAIQVNNRIGVAVQVQPLLAASDAEDLKKLLKGDQS